MEGGKRDRLSTFVVLILLCGTVGSCYGFCRPSDESALLNLKQGFLDYGGRFKTWTSGTDCCNWRSISCTQDSATVTGLSLDYVQVDKSKPGLWEAALGNLTGLTYLSLVRVRIAGPFPKSITKLPNLDILSISGCNLTGSIPPEIAKLSKLSELSITSEIALTGAVPEEFCNMTNLINIDFFSVAVTALPNCFERLTRLYAVFIQNCFQISSPIPISFGKCAMLESLYLTRSNFSGPIPDFFATLPNLRYLDLSGNQLTGPFPKSLANLSAVVNLNINYNRLQGPLPDLSKLTQLQALELMGNRFSGELPRSLQALSQLNNLKLDSNMFSGSIPPDFSNFCNIGAARQCAISLTYNQLTGPIPPRFLNVSNYNSPYGQTLQAIFDISHNRLSGLIPRSIGPHLQSLAASNNYLTGGFPLELATVMSVDLSNNRLDDARQTGELPILYTNQSRNKAQSEKILELSLANNQLKGPFPEWLYLLKNSLAMLDISSNYFWGVLPDAVYDFVEMQKLNASHNYFSGYLPTHPFKNTGFGTVIVALDLHHNYFSGPIAPSFFNSIKAIGGIFALDLSENRLVGGLPKEIGSVGAGTTVFGFFPERINLSNNLLSGPIPPEIGNLAYLRYLDLSYNKFSGKVPSSLGNLVTNGVLTYLDLQENDLPFPQT